MGILYIAKSAPGGNLKLGRSLDQTLLNTRNSGHDGVSAVVRQLVQEGLPGGIADDGGVAVSSGAGSLEELVDLRKERASSLVLHLGDLAPGERSVFDVPGGIVLDAGGDVEVDDGLSDARLDGGVVGHAVADGLDERLAEREDEAVESLGTVTGAETHDYGARLFEETSLMSGKERVRVRGFRHLVTANEELRSKTCS